MFTKGLNRKNVGVFGAKVSFLKVLLKLFKPIIYKKAIKIEMYIINLCVLIGNYLKLEEIILININGMHYNFISYSNTKLLTYISKFI